MYVTSPELHAAKVDSNNSGYPNEDRRAVGEGADPRRGAGLASGRSARRVMVSQSGRRVVPLVCMLLGAALAASANATSGVAEVEKSVVRIVSYVAEPESHSSGTGFIVTDSGLVVTNFHVIHGADKVFVHVSGSEELVETEVVYRDPGRDLAVLRAPDLDGVPLTLSSAPLRKRDEVHAHGFPGLAEIWGEALDPTFTDGVIGRLFTGSWGAEPLDIIQHSAPVNPGNSGGPLVNACGSVIGVNTKSSGAGRIMRDEHGEIIDVMAGQGVFFASRITETIEVLRGLGETVTPNDTRCVPADEAAQQAAQDAQQGVDSLQQDLDAKTQVFAEAMRVRDRRFWLISALLALAVAAALAFALRKPRGQIVRAVGYAAERLSQVVQDRRHGRPRRGIAMSGFLASGQPLNVMLAGRHFSRQGHGLTVGRNPALVDAVLSDTHVSRRHLRVRWTGKGFEVEDLNSSNGTILNGRQLAPFEPRPLGTGDLIRIGRLELQVSMA